MKIDKDYKIVKKSTGQEVDLDLLDYRFDNIVDTVLICKADLENMTLKEAEECLQYLQCKIPGGNVFMIPKDIELYDAGIINEVEKRMKKYFKKLKKEAKDES